MATIDDIQPEPWVEARHGWRGELISADGASTKDFRRRDVADVLQYAKTEADWGPTGDGFVCDAYGGTADLIFGHSQAAVLNRLSERARNLLIDYGM